MFERFTDRARRVVVLAQEEARMLDHDKVGTEHILLGLIHEGHGVAAKALQALDIRLDTVRERIEETIGRGQAAPSGHIPFTPRAKKVLELSLREALQLGHNYIGTEHILLGLIREGDGVAAQVLVSLGADLNRVRQQVIELLGLYKAGDPQAGPGASPGAEAVRRERLSALADLVSGVAGRLSGVEQRLGDGPDLAELDAGLAAARREKDAAITAEEYERAAQLRDTERDLAAGRAAATRDWEAAHPTLSALAEEVTRLRSEVDRLSARLADRDAEPGAGEAGASAVAEASAAGGASTACGASRSEVASAVSEAAGAPETGGAKVAEEAPGAGGAAHRGGGVGVDRSDGESADGAA
jgi:ATP-dependent Clp protease ATP-binding subunit ClpA